MTSSRPLQLSPDQGRSYNRVRTAVRDGQIVLLKRCPVCGEDKLCSEGPESAFYLRRRRDGRAKGWHSYCKACDFRYRKERKEKINAGRRARHAERMRTDPEYRERHNEQSRRSNAKWLEKPGSREKAKASAREHRARQRKADSTKVNELQRMDYYLRREREGKTPRERVTVIDGTAPRALVGPFSEWLIEYARIAGYGVGEDRDEENLARSLDLVPRRVRGILNGESRRVSVDIVSRALTEARQVVFLDGRPIVTINDLYGEDFSVRGGRGGSVRK